MKIKWINIDGLMTAIDKETGEILNESLNTLPIEFDVNDCIETVLFGGDSFGPLLPTSVIQIEGKRGPKPKTVSNPYASYFSNVHYNEYTGNSNMNSLVDDLVSAAANASTGNTRIPVKQLIHVMKSESLTTTGIQQMLSKRRILKGENSPEDRYCRSLRAAAEGVITRLESYENAGKTNLNDGYTFSFEADSESYRRSEGLSRALVCPVEFSERDRGVLRAFAKAGQSAKADSYVQGIREFCKRASQRFEIFNSPISAASALHELNNEFPFDPYSYETITYKVKAKRKVGLLISHIVSI